MRVLVLLAVGVVPVPAFGQPPRVDALGDPLPDRAVARLGTSRLMCTAPVQSVAFSADGKTVITAGAGGVREWEWPSGKFVRALPNVEHAQSVWYTPDGTRVVALALGFKFVVWDAKTGERTDEIAIPPVSDYRPERVAVGNAVFTAPQLGKEVAVYDLKTGKWAPVRRENPILAAAVDADGRALVAEIDEKGVRVTSAEPGKVDRRVPAKEEAGVVFGPGAAWVGVKDEDGTFTTVTLADGKPAFPPQKLPRGFPKAFDRGGTRAVLGVGPDGVVVWDLAAGKAVTPVPPDPDRMWSPSSAAFTPDGRHVAVAFDPPGPHAPLIFDAATGRPADLFPGQRAPHSGLVFLPGGRELVAASSSDATLRVWDIGTGKVVRSVATPNGVDRVWQVDGGRKLVTKGSWDSGRLRLWDAGTLADRGVLFDAGEEKLTDPVPWPDGGRVAYARDAGGRVRGRGEIPYQEVAIRDVATGRDVPFSSPRAPLRYTVADVAGNADTLVLSGCCTVSFVPVKDPGAARTVRDAWFRCAAVSADGRFVAFCQHAFAGDNPPPPPLLRVFEVRTAREVYSAKLPAEVGDIALSPAGPLVGCPGGDGVVRVVDYTTGKEVLALRVAGGNEGQLAFSPDGARLATAGTGREAGRVYVWDVSDLKRPAAAPAAAADLAGWVKALADPDPAVAVRAAWELIDRPAAAVAELALAEPPPGPDPKRVAALIADLGVDDFQTREAATRELIRMGDAARKPSADALATSGSAEQRQRLREVLRAASGGRPSRDVLFASRAALVLERVGGKDAVAVLAEMRKKGGALADEAAAALARLGEPAGK